jgi:hypothetical protein
MTCRHVQRLLIDEPEARGAAAISNRKSKIENRKSEVAAHLERCPACRRYQAALRANRADLDSLDALSVPDGLARRAFDRWEAESVSAPIAGQRGSLLRPVAIAVAAMALLAALGLASRPHPKSGPSFVARGDKPAFTIGVPKLPTAHGENATASKPGGSPSLAHHRPADPGPPPTAPGAPKPRSTPLLANAPTSSAAPQDDLAYVNIDSAAHLSRWTQLPPDTIALLEKSVQRTLRLGDDFVYLPFPRIASSDSRGIQAAVAAYRRQAAIIDPRLSRTISLHEKALAFSDLCDRLRQQTGIKVYANQSVADDKITLFCKDRPLREIMRQITHVFGFKWLRSDDGNEDHPETFTYYLIQDLKSRLAEEELRNHDRNAALLAVDAEMEKYRKYLSLSPEEAKAQAANASGEDKRLLERLGGPAWAAAHLYFGLSPDDMTALQNGATLAYGSSPQPGEHPLPGDVTSGILQSLRDVRIKVGQPNGNGKTPLSLGPARSVPDGQPPSAVPGAQAVAQLELQDSEVGQFTLNGSGGVSISTGPDGSNRAVMVNGSDLAEGVSPSVKNPNNAATNAKLANDPALQKLVTVAPKASCQLEPDPLGEREDPTLPKVTSADVLETLHAATGMDIVADYYTHLYSPEEVTHQNLRLFDALNSLADRMHDRWNREEGWLQFRGTGYFNDRVKEVPNRLLAKWAASRQKSGVMPAEDLMEIAGLSDAQLNAQAMAEGARACYGLKEWQLARSSTVRAHWRFLAALPFMLRQAAWSPQGLAFEQLPLALQSQFLSLVVGRQKLGARPPNMTGATLHVDYSKQSPDIVTGAHNGKQGPPAPGTLATEDIEESRRSADGNRAAPSSTAGALSKQKRNQWDISFIYLYSGDSEGSSNRKVYRSHGFSSEGHRGP